MANTPLEFINLAYGGSSVLYDQETWYPQDFMIEGRPEYGAAMPWMKAADHFRGVMYGNKRSLDFEGGGERLSTKVGENTTIAVLAIPQYSQLHGFEFRVDSVFTDNAGQPVAGVQTELRLATTGEVIATIPLDAKGATYVPLTGVLAKLYTDYGNDAIEMVLQSVPTPTETEDEFVCVPLPCADGFGLCVSMAVNFINNAIEPRCERPCEDSPE